MCGECEKLNGDVVTKMNFYFQGKYFETSEEMFDYAKIWHESPLDRESAERAFDMLKYDVLLNLFMRDIKFCNSSFSELVNRGFNFFLNEINKHDK